MVGILILLASFSPPFAFGTSLNSMDFGINGLSGDELLGVEEDSDSTNVIPDAAIREYASLSSFPLVRGEVLNSILVKDSELFDAVAGPDGFGGVSWEADFLSTGRRLNVDEPSLFRVGL